MIRNYLPWFVCSLSVWLATAPGSVVGQVVPDNTLPVNSVSTYLLSTEVLITGTVAGGNLFHSFQEFSVSTGGTVSFNNPLDIQNMKHLYDCHESRTKHLKKN